MVRRGGMGGGGKGGGKGVGGGERNTHTQSQYTNYVHLPFDCAMLQTLHAQYVRCKGGMVFNTAITQQGLLAGGKKGVNSKSDEDQQ